MKSSRLVCSLPAGMRPGNAVGSFHWTPLLSRQTGVVRGVGQLEPGRRAISTLRIFLFLPEKCSALLNQQFISFNILTIDLTNSSPSYDRFIWQRFLTNRGQKILPLRHDVHGYQGSQNPKGSENNPTMGKESSDLKTAAYDVKISLSW